MTDFLDDEFKKQQKHKEAVFFVNAIAAQVLKEKAQLIELLAAAPESLNLELKKISLDNGSMFEVGLRQTIDVAWGQSDRLNLIDAACNVDGACCHYMHDESTRHQREEVRKQVRQLIEKNELPATEQHIETIVMDIIDDIYLRLVETLFKESMRRHSVPEAAIRRLYPSTSFGSPADKLQQCLMKDYLYPDMQPSAPRRENILRFFKPRDKPLV